MNCSFFFKKNRCKNINRTSISQLYSGVLSGYNQGLQMWSPGMTAHENLDIIFFNELQFLNTKLECCQGTIRVGKSGVQVTAQFFLVFEIWGFL